MTTVIVKGCTALVRSRRAEASLRCSDLPYLVRVHPHTQVFSHASFVGLQRFGKIGAFHTRSVLNASGARSECYACFWTFFKSRMLSPKRDQNLDLYVRLVPPVDKPDLR